MSPRKREAFTLIELLVVISVIMLLAALVSPAVMRALQQAQRTHCRSNLHQLHSMFMLYANTFGRKLPPVGLPSTATDRRSDCVLANWWRPVADCLYHSYAGQKLEIFYCPSADNDNYERLWNVDWWATGVDWLRRTQYCAATNVVLDPNYSSSHWHRDEIDFRVVSLPDQPDKALLFDLTWLIWDWPTALINHKASDGMPAGGNIAHLDGRVTWKDFDRMQRNYSYHLDNKDFYW